MAKKQKKRKQRHREGFDSFIRKTIDEIQKETKYQDYKITFGLSKKEMESEDGQSLAATISVDTTYLQAHITISPYLKRAYKKGDIQEVRRVLCHEVVHGRTQKLFNYAINRFAPKEEVRSAWETLTEEYSRIVYDFVYNK